MDSKKIVTLFALAAGSLSQGCDAGPNADATEMAATQERFELIEGPDVVSCWAERDTSTNDDFFRSDALYCQRLDVSGFPLSIHGSVNAFGDDGNAGGMRLADLGTEPVKVLSLKANEYPAEVQIDLLIDPGDVAGLGHGRLVHTFEVAQPDIEPTTVRVPFDLWALQITALEASLSSARVDPYMIDVAPFTERDASEIAIEQAWLPNLEVGKQDKRLLAVSRGTTELSGKARVGLTDDVPFTLTGAGRYVVDPNGLRPLDERDEAARSEGPTFAQCWVEPVIMPLPEDAPEGTSPETRYQPTCSSAVVEHLDVLGLSVQLTAQGQASSTAAIALDGSKTALTEPLTADQLPVALRVDASLASAAVGFRDALRNEALGFELTLTMENVDTWVPLALPFAFGTVTLLPDPEGNVQMFQAMLDDYVVVLGRPWAGLHSLAIANQELPFVVQGGVTATYVVSSTQTELVGKALFFDGATSTISEETAFSLSLGGTYQVTSAGLVTVEP